MITTIPHNPAIGYWNIVKHLTPDAKIELITLLTQSLKDTAPRRVSAKKYYGIWGEDGMTDEEFIEEVKSLRSFNRDIVEL